MLSCTSQGAYKFGTLAEDGNSLLVQDALSEDGPHYLYKHGPISAMPFSLYDLDAFVPDPRPTDLRRVGDGEIVDTRWQELVPAHSMRHVSHRAAQPDAM